MNLASLSKINLADLGKRKDILVVTGIILLTVIIGNRFIYQAQRREMSYLREKIREEETKNRLIKEAIGLNKRMDSYQKRLPSRRDASWLMGSVARLAKEAQIKVVSFQPKEVDNQEGYMRIPLEVRVRGSYHELGRFLNKIENSQKFIKLDSLSLNVSETEGEGGEGAKPLANLIVSTIYLKE